MLPIGKQDFRKLQESGCIYVDKTQLIYELCERGEMYFLSRRYMKLTQTCTLKQIRRSFPAS